jgi:hypothetical protein
MSEDGRSCEKPESKKRGREKHGDEQMRMSMKLARQSFWEQVVLLYILGKFSISVSPPDAQAQLFY